MPIGNGDSADVAFDRASVVARPRSARHGSVIERSHMRQTGSLPGEASGARCFPKARRSHHRSRVVLRDARGNTAPNVNEETVACRQKITGA